MRKSLQIYLKQICPSVEWEERQINNDQDIKAQFVSSLMTQEQVRNEIAGINDKKGTIGLNLKFNKVESKQFPGQFRIVCNLKGDLNNKLDRQKLKEIALFLNTVYGDSTYAAFFDQKIVSWRVSKRGDGYAITMNDPARYIVPALPLDISFGQFIYGIGLKSRDVEHPCKSRVLALAHTYLQTTIYRSHTDYHWDSKSIGELYELMQEYKKNVTYANGNIPSKVADAALSDITVLYVEMKYQIGFFLNLSDAGVLAQVRKGSQDALRQEKINCEQEEQQIALSM